MNKRRDILIALAASALTTPFGSIAQQQGKVWRVGFLSQRTLGPLDTDVVGGFPIAMRGLGYVEGKNLVIEWRSADGNYDRLAGLAADLVKMNVDVIVTVGGRPTVEAQKATTTIPIVFGSANDPVGMGLVKSLAHPGGNITGLANISSDFAPKLLQMLISMVPRSSRWYAVRLGPTFPPLKKRVWQAAQRCMKCVSPLYGSPGVEARIWRILSVSARVSGFADAGGPNALAASCATC